MKLNILSFIREWGDELKQIGNVLVSVIDVVPIGGKEKENIRDVIARIDAIGDRVIDAFDGVEENTELATDKELAAAVRAAEIRVKKVTDAQAGRITALENAVKELQSMATAPAAQNNEGKSDA